MASIQVTPENEAEILKAAEDAAKPEQSAAPEGSPPEGEQKAETPGTDDLRIKGEEQKAEDEKKSDEEKKAEEAVESKLNMSDYFAEYAEKGKLSDESRTKIVDVLSKAGFEDAESILNDYIAGKEAQVTALRNEAFSFAGGEDGYKQMVAWALSNLTPAQIEAYNDAVDRPGLMPLAVRGLHAQYLAATGKAPGNAAAPRRVAPQANINVGVELVRSDQQVADLVGDPRYLRDPGYRAQVDQRIRASIDAGVLK